MRVIIVKEKGLENLVLLILENNLDNIEIEVKNYFDEEKEVFFIEDVLKGVRDIIVELVLDDVKIRKYIRELVLREGMIVSKSVIDEKLVYDMYYDYSEVVKSMVLYRVLVINRGEKESFLKVKLEINNDKVLNYIINEYVNDKNFKNKEEIVSLIEDFYKRLIFLLIEREIRNYLIEIV